MADLSRERVSFGRRLDLVLPDDAGTVERTAARVVATRIAERGASEPGILTRSQWDALPPAGRHESAVLVTRRGAPCCAGFVEQPPDGADGYVLKVADAARDGVAAVVCGADERGVLYGMGRLLRSLDIDAAEITAPILTERTRPVTATRGVYCATHFNNWYESSPIEEFERYVEDLALWGANTLWNWFDMNWYPWGFWDNPDSRGSRMMDRIRRVNRMAHSLGMDVGLTGIANEGFRNQPPPDLKVVASGWRGGFYPDSQICPSKPGGLDLILGNRRRVLELVGPIDAYWYWPYDQGGCGCPDCQGVDGWGGTFLRIGPAIAAAVREASPKARFITSTWLFDDHEIDLACREARSPDCWFDGLLVESHHAGTIDVPPGLDLCVFPEISMFDGYFLSYGCSGANPAPRRFAADAGRVAKLGYGAVLYSEGVYEDINKTVWMASLWDPERSAESICEEYAEAHFGRTCVAEASGAIMRLEETWGAERLRGCSIETAQALREQLTALEPTLPSGHSSWWRWRVLMDRSILDALMVEIGPGAAWVPEVKRLYDEAGFSDDADDLRSALADLLARLRKRGDVIDELYAAYRSYLERFHLSKVWLIHRPDPMLGSIDFRDLVAACERALGEHDDDQMRREFILGVHRWFWFNGVDEGFVYA